MALRNASRRGAQVVLGILFLLDVANSMFIAPAASPPPNTKEFTTPAASKKSPAQGKSKAKLQPLQPPHSLSHSGANSDVINEVDGDAEKHQAQNKADAELANEADAKLQKLNRGCPCKGTLAAVGETGCACDVKWKNVWVDRAPKTKQIEKSIDVTTLVPTLVDLGTTLIPQDVSTIHVTEYPVITATSMVPTEWPEFLGTSLVPERHTTYEMRPEVVGTSLVPEMILERPGEKRMQQVIDCVNCGEGGFLEPKPAYPCCPKLFL